MEIQKIRQIARKKGIDFRHVSKPDLIRTIQRVEGNYDCFASRPVSGCDQMNCLWREDCGLASASAI
jgi:hypothetical protein